MTDIQLPPLPEPDGYIPRTLESGEIVEIGAVSQSHAIEYVRSAVELDRQQRGEAVAWREILPNLIRPLDGVDTNQSGYHHASGWNDAIRRVMDVLRANTAPQLAEPVVKQSLTDENQKLREALQNTLAHCLSWQGEPGEHSCEIHAAVVEQARAALAQPTAQQSLQIEPVKGEPSDEQVSFDDWWEREMRNANSRGPGDDWLDLNPIQKENYRACWEDAQESYQGAQPAASAEPIQVTTVATVTYDDSDEGPVLKISLEGGASELPDGAELVWASTPITGNDGRGVVYTAPVAAQLSVPEFMKYSGLNNDDYAAGWNDCRAAMLHPKEPPTPPASSQEGQQ